MKKTSNLSLSFVLTRQKKYPFGDAIAAAALFAGILGTFCTPFSLTAYLPLLMLGGALVIAAAFLPERQRRIRQAALLVLLIALFALSVPALAAGEPVPEAAAAASSEADVTSSKAMASGAMIGVACLGGALAMGIAVSKSTEAIARQPEAAGPIRAAMMMGLVFIETVIIYALIVAILIIFVL